MSEEQPKSVGLGDTVANAIKTITFGTVKPCQACKKRQEALNQMFPYKQGENGQTTPPAKPCQTCNQKKA
jgi:hypothetical protein